MPNSAGSLEIATISKLIQADPDYFFKDILGVELWERERQIVYSIRDNRKTAVRSCHSSGKTFTLARAALWFLYGYAPAVVIDTAPTDRQVRNQFWREFRFAHQKAKVNLGGELLKTQFNIDENWYAFGFSTRETEGGAAADKFQGFHGQNILIIVDEASGVSESIFEAIDGSMSSGFAVRLVYIGNPTRREGTFANAFSDPTFKHMHISAFDTPNFFKNNIRNLNDLTEEKVKAAKMLMPGLALPDWALDMKRKYGADSDVFRVRVLGNFPTKSSDTLIGVDAVEMAMNRELPNLATEEDKEEWAAVQEVIGVDVARYGDDSTVIVLRKGHFAEVLDKMQSQNTMETVGKVRRLLMARPNAIANIDVIGIGAGVFDRLVEMADIAHRVNGINSAQAAMDKEQYKNLRAEGWDLAKEWLKTGILKPDEDWYQLAKPKYKIVSSGQMQLESKEDLKKRNVNSPDVADAFVLTLMQPTESGNLDVIAII